MTPHDQSNLNFLMSLNSKSIAEWFKTQDTANIMYALSLLHDAENAGLLDAPIDDFTEANKVLAQYMLH